MKNIDELKKSVLDELYYYRNAWQSLCGENCNHLENRIIAIDIAINIVKKKFEGFTDEN